MKRIAFRPSLLCVKLLALATLLVLLLTFIVGKENVDTEILVFSFSTVLGVLVFDLLRSRKALALNIDRSMPKQLSFNRWHTVNLVIENNSHQDIQFYFDQHINDDFEKEITVPFLSLAAKEKLSVEFRVKSLKRGATSIDDIELCILSPWKLWHSYWLYAKKTAVKVYPDFKRINQQHSLKGISNTSKTGLKKLKKRGDGIEFHQLRDYRHGDSIRQIDWQATSKRQKLIAKEYQEERNQHIIVMLDAGVNMNIDTASGTHFDAALNALLMLSHTVLKQGDFFSMQSFNQNERWLPAVKGAQNVSRVMNHFYDLEADESASDYTRAAQSLLSKRSKRSLVLLVTTLNDHGFIDLLPAIKQLQQHHLIALVNINNVALTDTLEKEIETIDDANSYCAAVELNMLYKMNIKRLSKEGVICVESKPEHLLPNVINTYLSVKNSGLL